MIRVVTTAFLLLINIAVWLGLSESLMGCAIATFDPAPQVSQAEEYETMGDYNAALKAFQALVETTPESASYRYEYGFFCYIHRDYLLQEAGWSKENLIDTVKEQLYRAHSLAKNDVSIAYRYALILMDDEFFGDRVSGEEVIDAWKSALTAIEEEHKQMPGWYAYPGNVAGALYQLARIESRFDHVGAARAYVEQARSIAPNTPIPESLSDQFS
ncbi:MAG: hypothetical protein L3K26_05885 [Candidatus Hydrogenedentes bacterium]|nr:hypothetical protein [Candidatus Hydrogenedentota bacterium]